MANLGNILSQDIQNIWVLAAIIAWTLPWKGVALWKAARKNHQWWFITMLVVNTLAILEILYIFIFSKRSNNNAYERNTEE